MPKKTTSTRGGAQRNRARTQKSFELVRPTPTIQEKELEAEEAIETAEATETARNNNGSEAVSVAASMAVSATGTTTRRRSSRPSVPQEPVAAPSTEDEEEMPSTITAPASTESAAPKSAAARLAARRTAAQKAQRTGVNLITAEHYAYVRADLIKIAILALIMFGIIIGLHFVPGIGS